VFEKFEQGSFPSDLVASKKFDLKYETFMQYYEDYKHAKKIRVLVIATCNKRFKKLVKKEGINKDIAVILYKDFSDLLLHKIPLLWFSKRGKNANAMIGYILERWMTRKPKTMTMESFLNLKLFIRAMCPGITVRLVRSIA
jgi:hypothetical protein